MKRALLWGLIGVITSGVSACSSVPKLPIYEVSWDGCIRPGLCKGSAVKAYVWGSPNPQDHPNFTSRGVLVRAGISPPWINGQYYNPAFESYGCFPEEKTPKQKRLYFLNTDTTVEVKKSELAVKQPPQQIPIEIQVKPLDAATQATLEKSMKSGAPSIQTFGGRSCTKVAN